MKRFKTFWILLLITTTFSCQTEEETMVSPEDIASTDSHNVEQAFPGRTGTLVKIDMGNDNSLAVVKIDGQYVFSGDILLTEEQVAMMKNNSSNSRTGITAYLKKWTDCTVYYTISSSLPNQSRVTDAIAHWEQEYPWIDFTQRTTQPNYIEFVPSTGCSSYVGMIGGRQTINLASGCTTGSTIHEIGHALGLLHEQQRADRDNWINIHWYNIESGYEFAFETYEQSGLFGFEIGQFDFNSIMLYESFAYSRNGFPTITRLDGSTFSANRTGLSAGDVETIEYMYSCEPYYFAKPYGNRYATNTGTYTWNSAVEDGVPPYTYVWKRSSDEGQTYTNPWGDGTSSYTTYMPYNENLYLELTVTDSNGEVATGYWVTYNTDKQGVYKPYY